MISVSRKTDYNLTISFHCLLTTKKHNQQSGGPMEERVVVKKISVFLWLTIFALTTLANQLFARDVEVVGDKNEKPRIYLEETTAKGYLPTILRYIEEKTDLRFNISLYPWARAYLAATKGNAAIIGLSKTAERKEIFDYTIPVYFEDLIVVSRTNNPVEYNAIEDLYGKKVGIVRGGVYGEQFEKARDEEKLTVVEDNSPTQRLLMLIHERVDVALIGSGRAGFNSALEQDKALLGVADRFFIADKPLTRDANYIGFAKSMKAGKIIEDINDAITEGYASGDLQKRIK